MTGKKEATPAKQILIKYLIYNNLYKYHDTQPWQKSPFTCKKHQITKVKPLFAPEKKFNYEDKHHFAPEKKIDYETKPVFHP